MIQTPGGRTNETGSKVAFNSRVVTIQVTWENGMQNFVWLCLTLILRLLSGCFTQLKRMFVLERAHPGRFTWSTFSLSVDLDSARLDVVSRSVFWGSGIPVRERFPAAGFPPQAAPRPVRWHATGAQTIFRRDA